MDKTEAILIRRYRYSETSLVCVWMSAGFGKIKTAARGALRSGGAFRGKIDLFFRSEIAFARPKAAGEVQTLREVLLLEPFHGMRGRYANLVVASYFAELCDAITEPMAPQPELYDLLSRAVRYLEESEPTMRAIEHFESEVCRLLGILDQTMEPAQTLARHIGRMPRTRAVAIQALHPRPNGRAPAAAPQP